VGTTYLLQVFVTKLLQSGITHLLQNVVSDRFCGNRPVAQLVRALP